MQSLYNNERNWLEIQVLYNIIIIAASTGTGAIDKYTATLSLSLYVITVDQQRPRNRSNCA